jgi:hypothetical protein
MNEQQMTIHSELFYSHFYETEGQNSVYLLTYITLRHRVLIQWLLVIQVTEKLTGKGGPNSPLYWAILI